MKNVYKIIQIKQPNKSKFKIYIEYINNYYIHINIAIHTS